MKYERIIRAIHDHPWAITQRTLDLILEIAHFRAQGGRLTAEDVRERIAAAQPQNGPRSGNRGSGTVAIIPIYGVIAPRVGGMESSGGTSVEAIRNDLRAALADPQVDAIVLDIDSPGGTVDGIPELAAEIRDARGQKPLVAVANYMAASAAYWIASAAQEVVVTPSGSVGSIGVIAAHEDHSVAQEIEGVKTTLITAGKYKAEANSYEPLSDEARAAIQKDVDTYYAMFVKAVAAGRGVPEATVRGGFGEGRVVLADESRTLGMVDRIDTLDNTVRRLGQAAATPEADPVGFPTLPFGEHRSEAQFGERGPETVALIDGVVVATVAHEAKMRKVRVEPDETPDDHESVHGAGDDTTDPGEEAPPASEGTFAARVEAVSADVGALIVTAARLAAVRTGAGRPLSHVQRARLEALRDSLDALLATPDRHPAATVTRSPRRLLELEAAERGYTLPPSN